MREFLQFSATDVRHVPLMIDAFAQSLRAVTDDGNWRFNSAEKLSELGNASMFHLQSQIAATALLHRL